MSSQREILQQLLEDMDKIRPIVIAAMPDDPALRTTTRRMIADLESMLREPAVPAATYLWLSQLTARLLDAEHGALLRPGANGEIPASARQPVQHHIEHRQNLLLDALQHVPAASRLLDQGCRLIGAPAIEGSIHDKARHLARSLQTHIKHDAELRNELQQLIEALNPSLDAISSLLQEAGEDSPELKQVKLLLDQELPDNVEQARKLLQDARMGIVQAGAKLASASERLQSTIQTNLEKISEMSNKLAQAESEARNDPLTGLGNRRQLAEFLNTLGSNEFCFLITDIDFFKKINDTYGHDVGDEVLQQLATLLKESIRSTDLVARVGGEEFCIIFPGTNIETSARLAESLRQAVHIKAFQTRLGAIPVTISIGIAAHQPGTSHAATFKLADEALYRSKRNGRNQVSIGKQEISGQ